MKKDMFLQPNWPAPEHIKACTTLRTGGVSRAPYHEFNLAQHVGDNEESVRTNRDLLKTTLQLPNEPIWINQTHSTITTQATPEQRDQEADASYTHDSNQTCVVLTADCLPILFCNQKGTYVAAIHAGWRGLLHGIIESTLNASKASANELLAWLGPAISAPNYEVGEEVREQFLNQDTDNEVAFSPSVNGRWLADLYALARIRLNKQGIKAIFGGDFCTFADPNRFYSYRRDGSRTGRMATLIWIKE